MESTVPGMAVRYMLARDSSSEYENSDVTCRLPVQAQYTSNYLTKICKLSIHRHGGSGGFLMFCVLYSLKAC